MLPLLGQRCWCCSSLSLFILRCGGEPPCCSYQADCAAVLAEGPAEASHWEKGLAWGGIQEFLHSQVLHHRDLS